MSESNRVRQIPHLADVGNIVPDGYSYYEKCVMPWEGLSLPNAYFKWYDIYPPEDEITPAQRAESRNFVAAEAGRLRLDNELGFVLLHRAGSKLLLLVTTWRLTNEIWESIYVKDVSDDEGYQILEFAQTHRGTFCVWELGVIWHERQAWVRFLSSGRDEQAKLAYINDGFAGLV